MNGTSNTVPGLIRFAGSPPGGLSSSPAAAVATAAGTAVVNLGGCGGLELQPDVNPAATMNTTTAASVRFMRARNMVHLGRPRVGKANAGREHFDRSGRAAARYYRSNSSDATLSAGTLRI